MDVHHARPRVTIELHPHQSVWLDTTVTRLARIGISVSREALLERMLLAFSKLTLEELEGLTRCIVDADQSDDATKGAHQ